MIKLDMAVVVEGKYDKITLENIIDATIITTDGFGIFKNREKCELIRLLAKKNGIIIMTDSDSAGALIRSHIKRICPEGRLVNVYIPQLSGKEKRKDKAGKQGLLGVEGMSREVLEDALRRSGISSVSAYVTRKNVTKGDMFELGLSGGENCAEKRERLAIFLGLPSGMSSSGLLDAINAVYGYDKFMEAVELWQSEGDKR